MPALMLAGAGAALAWVLFKRPSKVYESDEGVVPGGDFVSLFGGQKSVEAWARGQSLGYISVDSIGGGKYLRHDAAAAFVRMRDMANRAGIVLTVNSAFRFMEEQQELWSQYQSGKLLTPVAQPGWSTHQNGLALDIQVGGTPTSPTYRWLAIGAGYFGWVNTGANFTPPEFWHWEYKPNV